ncbi:MULTISPECIES: iron-siderophore ABC transporter substrate-binding protein [unclassified Rhodococcus (in: high G+C Gram-positive bacteria)]|uniref:iron-siderophore ABC transporter substrate-binding protein n=1 Tax=unclassified Rhodococcus (in: high G+C Gram-positive bacteria) TaxID=192944 RepID=UPI0029541D21|nr:iron-siderophore ABC transporter substrate-binding protein [Rhodococcus sp. IEGM 1343]MDV8054293.1 iron-siderophore ABC transporter substrate-binding protein [Rhodococcus sp. IEGM 1343]
MTVRWTRMLTAVVAVIALGVALTACSTADTGDTATQSADGVFPVVIDHIYGSTTIAEKPTRIVTLGVSDADAVIALGTVPVGNAGYTFYETGLGPWTYELVGDAPLTLLGSESEPNFELIASLAPDLITGLNAGFDEATYTRLSDIAPTVARPAGSAAYAVNREVATDTIARAMGERERGEELNAQTTAALEQVRAAHPEFAGKTAAVVLPYDGQFGAYLPGDARGTFVTSLGFEIPEPILAQDDGTNFFVPVSAENISQLDADVVLYLGTGDDIDVVAENPIFGTLTAARNDAIVPLSIDQRGAITYNSVLSIPFAIDAVVPRVAEAVA